MLETILSTVLTTQYQKTHDNINGESDQRPDSILANGLDDQVWLENGFDLDFWTTLQEHPLLTTWPDDIQVWMTSSHIGSQPENHLSADDISGI